MGGIFELPNVDTAAEPIIRTPRVRQAKLGEHIYVSVSARRIRCELVID
jgi:hypothetical protein